MLKKIKDIYRADRLVEQVPESDFEVTGSVPDSAYRSFVFMRIMLVAANVFALIFCRSLLQSWQEVKGTTPIWIPLIFLLIPLGSLAFVYLFMGKVGSERIMKIICLFFCACHIFYVFQPPICSNVEYSVDLTENGYLTEIQSETGIAIPSGETVTMNNSIITVENPNEKFSNKLKRFLNGEKIIVCVDVSFNEEQSGEFEKAIDKNPIWLCEIPDNLRDLQFSAVDADGYDCFVFFDCDGKTFNTVPNSKSTVCQFMYSSQNAKLRIIKYSKKF